MEENCQIHGRPALAVRKKGSHYSETWMDLRVSLYVSEGIDYSFSVTVLEPPKVQRIAYSLYQLRYPRRNLDQLNKDRAADSEE